MLIHQYMKQVAYFRSLPPLDTLFDHEPTTVPDLQYEYNYWQMFRYLPTQDVNFLFNVRAYYERKEGYWRVIRRFLKKYCGSTILRSQKFITNLPDSVFRYSYMVEWKQKVRLPLGRVPIIGRYIALLDSFSIEVPDLNLAVTFPQRVMLALQALQHVLNDHYMMLMDKYTLRALSDIEQEYLAYLSSYTQDRRPSTYPEKVQVYHVPKKLLTLPYREGQKYGIDYPLLPYRYIPIAPFTMLFNHESVRLWWYDVYRKHPNPFVKRLIALLLLGDQGIIGPTLARFTSVQHALRASFITATLFPFVRGQYLKKSLRQVYDKARLPRYIVNPEETLKDMEEFVEYVHTYDFNHPLHSYVACARTLFSNPYGFLEDPREIFTNSKGRVILLVDSEPIKQEFPLLFSTRATPKFYGHLPPRQERDIIWKGGLV